MCQVKCKLDWGMYAVCQAKHKLSWGMYAVCQAKHKLSWGSVSGKTQIELQNVSGKTQIELGNVSGKMQIELRNVAIQCVRQKGWRMCQAKLEKNNYCSSMCRHHLCLLHEATHKVSTLGTGSVAI